jgi:hypothetical protein
MMFAFLRKRKSAFSAFRSSSIPAFAGMMMLVGCDRDQAQPQPTITCRPAGATTFELQCTVERNDSPDGVTLTLRNPDGRFRRLLVTRDGHGVLAADGAEPAVVRMSGKGEIEVKVGGDHYRLPARPKDKAESKK